LKWRWPAQIAALHLRRCIIGHYANAGANNQQSPPNVANSCLQMRNTAASSLKSGTVAPERLGRASQSLIEKPFTLLPITSRLSRCLKLTSFKVLNLDGAKNKNNRGV
jgi:hypothetical protein